ncbi:TraR/DksA C4-type zinc finger protein [Pseudomonas sp. NPDC090201]|uniref:TraR/DksA C4-type zinc finger protein n=1 Tax=Pseudomonas sp. NPDC090201 TaxID=3364475 RepID=UPI003825F5B9
MDVTDIATEAEDAFREQALAAQRAVQAHHTGASATHCESCGEAIPDARRLILPGVELCVACQSDFERMGR